MKQLEREANSRKLSNKKVTPLTSTKKMDKEVDGKKVIILLTKPRERSRLGAKEDKQKRIKR